MWLSQKELTEAVEALKKIKTTTHDKKKLLIKHPTSELTDRQWEAAILAIFAVYSDGDAVLSEGTYLLYGVG